jgi:hypothetical protein
LLGAESYRKFIDEHVKNSADYRNVDQWIKANVDINYDVMKWRIISTQEQILDLRKQLKKVRGE